MSAVTSATRDEYIRYKALADAAMAQVAEDDLSRVPSSDGNSIATLVWHLAGNFESRFTDFLTADGEKSWRDRDGEFEPRAVTRAELLSRWEAGWRALFTAVNPLTDVDLVSTVTVRGQPLQVDQALLRSLAHAAYHVGQIVLLAKHWRGAAWECLSIPRGGSAAYNRAPDKERPAGHAAALGRARS